MSTKEPRPLIFERISAVMSDIGPIAKDRQAGSGGYAYAFRGIDDFYNAAQPALIKHKVFLAPFVEEMKREEKSTKNGVAMVTVLRVRFRVYTEDGSFIEMCAIGEAMDSGDKGANKAMSAAMKYALMQLFAVPTEGDNDTDTENETHEIVKPEPKAERPSVKPEPKPAANIAPKKSQAETVASFRKEFEAAPTLIDLKAIGERLSKEPQTVKDACKPAYLAAKAALTSANAKSAEVSV